MRIETQKSNDLRSSGFTLAEVCISLMITAIVGAGAIMCYTQSAYRAQWSAYSLAAQAAAVQQMERVRAAKWQPLSSATSTQDQWPPGTTTNSPGYLNIPHVSGGTSRYDYYSVVTVTNISSSPMLRMIQVDCIWTNFNGLQVFTNTVCAVRAPDL